MGLSITNIRLQVFLYLQKEQFHDRYNYKPVM